MKKIFMVLYYFAPLGRADGVNRTYFVKYLSELGWDVDVITGEEYRSLILNFQTDHSLLKIIPPSVNIKRFESHQGWLIYDIKKTLGIGKNLRQAWINNVVNNFEIKNKGVIYAFVPPAENAIAAYELAKKYKLPLVLHYVDDFFEVDPTLVEEAIKHANLIIAVTPQIKKNLTDRYNHKNVVVFRNGYADPVSIQDKSRVNSPIKIAYAGSLNFRTRPEIFAKACQELIKQNPGMANDFEVDFFGPDGYYHWLFLRPYLGGPIKFKGYLSFHHLMSALKCYDMALATAKGDISFVSKIYHYLNAGLPILTLSENKELDDFILNNQIGISSSFQIENVVDQLKILLANKDNILTWRQNVLKIRDQYALKTSVSKITDILNNTIINEI